MLDKDHEFMSFGGHRGWSGHRLRRGDMAPIILKMLSEKPMHGYEIIGHLEEKSYGFWRPSAGSIYPNLQLLEEQDLVSSSQKNGKKVYTITDKGRAEAGKTEEHYGHYFKHHEPYAKAFKDLKVTSFEIMASIRQIAALDSEEKNAEVKKILDETKTKLSQLLNQPKNN